MKRKIFCLLLAILTAVSTFACGKNYDEENMPCSNCGYIHFGQCLFIDYCNICGEKGHSTEKHPICGICDGSYGLLHSEDECTAPHCEICNENTHTTEEHPKCAGCDAPLMPDHDEEKCLADSQEAESGSSSSDIKVNPGKDGESSSSIDKPKSEPKSKPKSEPKPKNETYCNTCKKYTNHTTNNCPEIGKTVCGACGHAFHIGYCIVSGCTVCGNVPRCEKCGHASHSGLCSECFCGTAVNPSVVPEIPGVQHEGEPVCENPNCMFKGQAHLADTPCLLTNEIACVNCGMPYMNCICG